MPDKSEIERIAKGLSEAQTKAIPGATTMHRLAFPSFERVSPGGCTIALVCKGLIRSETNRFVGARGVRETRHYGLTPLGLAVRASLQDQS